MSAVHSLRPEFVEAFPAVMDQEVLYISIPYNTCGHLCCCGCGQEVVTPLSPAQWSLTYDGQNASLRPSIGNWGLPCQSHYWIREGKVVWSRRYTPEEIATNRDDDRRRLTQHFDTIAPTPPPAEGRRRWLARWRRSKE
jgi:hypothetical protein